MKKSELNDSLKNASKLIQHQINVILAIKAELSGIDDGDLTHAEKKIKRIISQFLDTQLT